MRKLDVIVFPGGFNLPLWVGQQQGFFHQNNVDVELHYTGSSMEQLAGLIEGRWDIGMTGIDNVIAYQEGQGEAKIDRVPDLFVFMGGDDAFLRLVVQGSISNFEDLRGKTLSVDAMTTGFAFVLRKMIEKAGLPDDAVTYVRAGGVMQRWDALKAGTHDGTLLLTPFDLIAEKLGLRVLQKASDVLPAYQGLVGTARRGWAKANGDALAQYIRGYIASLDWLYQRVNRASAAALLMRNVPNMSEDIALRTYDILLADTGGFERRARLDMDGIRTVLALRSQYGLPQKTLTDPHLYVDPTWHEQALADIAGGR